MWFRHARGGVAPHVSDAELLTLAVAQILLGVDGEHRWIRFTYCRLGPLFPYLPQQSGLHHRLKTPGRCWARRSRCWPNSARRGSTTCG